MRMGKVETRERREMMERRGKMGERGMVVKREMKEKRYAIFFLREYYGRIICIM